MIGFVSFEMSKTYQLSLYGKFFGFKIFYVAKPKLNTFSMTLPHSNAIFYVYYFVQYYSRKTTYKNASTIASPIIFENKIIMKSWSLFCKLWQKKGFRGCDLCYLFKNAARFFLDLSKSLTLSRLLNYIHTFTGFLQTKLF